MKRSIASLLSVFALTAFYAGEASALVVAEGCASPKSLSSRHAFYVDPQNGRMDNDGSAARPWSTLAEVLDSRKKLVASPAAPIRPGDIVYLNSGDHGHVNLIGASNEEFITVQAAPGQTPTLRSLRVNGASKWMFVGLSIQSEGKETGKTPPGPTLVEFGRNSSAGPADNIVFAGNSVSTIDDSSAWSDQDWVKKPFEFGLLSSAKCVSIAGNHFFNLRNAVQFDGENHLIADNEIDRFANDAINIVASNAVVRNNLITQSRHFKIDLAHPDGIQGWTKGDATNANVTIDGNTIIKTGDPQIGEMHGITVFDGKWERLTISNNVVVTNHWHGITVFGAANSKIINNTVVSYDIANRPTWITVQNAKDGRPSENVIVRNNITTRLVHHGDNIVVDHNIAARMIATSASGKPIYILKPGKYGDHNIIDPNIYDSLVSVDHSKSSYDFRLKPGSPAIGTGNPQFAPKTDILGKRRTVPVDIGAYAKSR